MLRAVTSLTILISLAACSSADGTHLPPSPTSPETPGIHPATLRIESFVVVPFQYPSDPTHSWYYTPKLRVRETGGEGTAEILKLTFDGWRLCVSGVHFTPSATFELFDGSYSDPDLLLDFTSPESNPLPARTVKLTIEYSDETGHRDSVSGVGPIVVSAPATTYAGPSAWSLKSC